MVSPNEDSEQYSGSLQTFKMENFTPAANS